MTFRDRLLGTLRQLRPVLDEPGVLIVGSEVPNLLQPDAASTLVVSQDVGLAIPVDRVGAVKARLRDVEGLVFGPLGLIRPGRILQLHDLRLPLPRVGDLIVEKLLTDRTGEKGARDVPISEDDARRLVADGYVPEACGRSLAPEKILLFIDEARVSTLPSAVPIPVTLGPQMLTAPAVALIAFEA